MLHLRETTGKTPHCYFGWTEGNPLKYLARFVFFGEGDIAPVTPLGKALASALMIMGYGVIAVPTGIVTLELDRAAREGDDRAIEARERDRLPECPRARAGNLDQAIKAERYEDAARFRDEINQVKQAVGQKLTR